MLSHWLFCWPRRWETIRSGPLIIESYDGAGRGYFYDLRCKHCGWIVYRKCY